jgi:Na+/proline symporter
LKSIFYSNKETWWAIGFSMIISGGILSIPQVMTSFVIKNDFSGLWIIWSAVIGTAFGKAFFAHLWHNVPTKTENELILFRYSGIGAKILHIFRSLYVGLLIAPIGLSMAFLAFGRIVSSLFNINSNSAIIWVLGFVIISTFFNSLKQRLKLDFIYLVVFVICLILIYFFLFRNLGNISDLNHIVSSQTNGIKLFPTTGTAAFNSFLIFVLLQWWSASIIDFPDINGQKLMASKNITSLSKSIVLPWLVMSVALIFVYTIPFFILLVKNPSLASISGEMAFLSILTNAIPPEMSFIVLIFFLLPFISAVNNTQNWSASLVVQNFYVHYINKNANVDKINRRGVFVMIIVVIISAALAMYSNSILDLIKFLFVITAGVGPVFILRWYWHRINAWSQLSAMVLSLVYPHIYEFLYFKSTEFKSTIDLIMQNLSLEYYPLKLVVLTIVVSTSWVLVTFITKPTDENISRRFAETVKPGGFWKDYKMGKSFLTYRLIIALVLTISGILFYFVFFKFVIGDYFSVVISFLLLIFITYSGYLLLKKIIEENAKK